jgi:hypothetical protein
MTISVRQPLFPDFSFQENIVAERVYLLHDSKATPLIFQVMN